MTSGELKELQKLAAEAAKQATRVKGLNYDASNVVISKRLLKLPDQGIETWASIGGIECAPAHVDEKGAIERLIGVLGSRPTNP